MGIRHYFIALLAVPNVVLADIPALDCAGDTDGWTLTLDPDQAEFAYLDRASVMQVMQHSTAEGADWPIAVTAIGMRDSAIILLEAPNDGITPLRILTQRGETPILLTGTCKSVP